MEQQMSGENSASSSEELVLKLPIPEAPHPRHHDLPTAWVYARNVEVMSQTCYDEAYFAARLARMVDVPFVL